MGGSARTLGQQCHRPQQDQCLRREHPPQPTCGVPTTGAGCVSGFSSIHAVPVQLHVRRPQHRVQEDGLTPEDGRLGSNTLRKPPRRRQRVAPTRHPSEGDQGTRSLDDGLKLEEVRESHGGAAASSQGSVRRSVVRQLRGTPAAPLQPAPHGGHYQHHSSSYPVGSPLSAPAQRVRSDSQVRKHLRNLLFQAKSQALQHKSQVFLELFCGSGAIARQLRRQGFGVVCLDICRSELEDISHYTVLRVLQGWISSGIVLGVWLGTPCATWSVAHTTPIVRTRKFLYGVPGLTGKHKLAVRAGNATARASACIIAACIKSCVPCFLENPQSSKLFLAPCIRELRLHPACQEFISHYCQYGTAWRKATKVCTWFSTSDAPQRRCAGPKPTCSRTQRRHIALSGSSPQGVPWTKIAEPYPLQWAKAWASVIVASATNSIARRLASLVSII